MLQIREVRVSVSKAAVGRRRRRCRRCGPIPGTGGWRPRNGDCEGRFRAAEEGLAKGGGARRGRIGRRAARRCGADDPGELYLNNLCTAPGWKTGGWIRWSPIDPVDRACRECGTEAVPLFTIASWEWDGGSAIWTAKEDRPTPGPPPLGARDGNFTLIDITGGNNLQFHVCPSSPYHPHFELLQ